MVLPGAPKTGAPFYCQKQFRSDLQAAKRRKNAARPELAEGLESLLRNSMAHTSGGTNRARAAERRHLLAQRLSAGKPEVEQTESALADDTSFVQTRKP